ncbi:hypothetical protein HDK64DRAFT_62340 [Phyllosticta capitalensis]
MECRVQPGCRWSGPLCTHHTIYWCGATHQCVVGRGKRPCLAAACTMLSLSNHLGGRKAASAHAINSASLPGVQRLCVWTFQTEQQKFHSPEKLCARPSALSSCSIINAVSAERMSIVAMLVAWQVLLQILEAVSCDSQRRLMELKAMKVSQRVRLARTCNHHKKGLIGATRLLILGRVWERRGRTRTFQNSWLSGWLAILVEEFVVVGKRFGRKARGTFEKSSADPPD